MSNTVQELFRKESEAILSIPSTNPYTEIIEAIYTAVHKNKGKLVASGMGKAGQIAINIATTFSSTGTAAVFLHPADAQHGDIGIIQPNDILLLVSNSGKTNEIIQLIGLCRRLVPDISIIVLTGNPDSPLGEEANWVLATGNPKEICPLGLTPTTSTTVMTVIGDVLVSMMMNRIGFSTEDYSKRHHGGYLGTKSRSASNNAKKSKD